MATNKLPWDRPELKGWLIIGMNHYNLNGEIQLFICMGKEGNYIKTEGLDKSFLWDELAAMAKRRDAQ